MKEFLKLELDVECVLELMLMTLITLCCLKGRKTKGGNKYIQIYTFAIVSHKAKVGNGKSAKLLCL